MRPSLSMAMPPQGLVNSPSLSRSLALSLSRARARSLSPRYGAIESEQIAADINRQNVHVLVDFDTGIFFWKKNILAGDVILVCCCMSSVRILLYCYTAGYVILVCCCCMSSKNILAGDVMLVCCCMSSVRTLLYCYIYTVLDACVTETGAYVA